jgi:hypothetical protein
MTKDDIICMAREAGIGWLERAEGISEFLERFANLVAAAEREACAQVCETEGERVDASWVSCAAAIRAKG